MAHETASDAKRMVELRWAPPSRARSAAKALTASWSKIDSDDQAAVRKLLEPIADDLTKRS